LSWITVGTVSSSPQTVSMLNCAAPSTCESHQEVSGMSEGSLNDHNDQSGLAHTHCAVLVLAKKG